MSDEVLSHGFWGIAWWGINVFFVVFHLCISDLHSLGTSFPTGTYQKCALTVANTAIGLVVRVVAMHSAKGYFKFALLSQFAWSMNEALPFPITILSINVNGLNYNLEICYSCEPFQKTLTGITKSDAHGALSVEHRVPFAAVSSMPRLCTKRHRSW